MIQQTNLLYWQFILMSFLFTRGIYSIFFACLAVLFIFIAFLQEEKRLIGWIMISFFLGNLLVSYIDQFIEVYPLTPVLRIVVSQLFLLLPILLISYVIRKFNKSIGLPLRTPINATFQVTNSVVISLKQVVYILITVLIVSNLVVCTLNADELSSTKIGFILLFSVIHAGLEEYLWRGILTLQFIRMTNERTGMIVSSAAFGLNSTMFGYSLLISLLFFSLGLLLSVLTIKSKSIYPSFIIHCLLLVLLLLTGWVVLPL
jgi:uncharacterized protein